MGHVHALFISPEAGQPMQPQQRVRVMAGLGIAGDRYATRKGFWSPKNPPKTRDVTIISLEAHAAANAVLAQMGIEPYPLELTRRNIVVSGVPELNDLIHRQFRIGTAFFVGEELATPCLRPAQLAGRTDRGFPTAFKNCGGIRAAVLSSGPVCINDTVEVRHGVIS